MIDVPNEETYSERFTRGIGEAFGYNTGKVIKNEEGVIENPPHVVLETENGMGRIEISYFPNSENGKEADPVKVVYELDENGNPKAPG